MSAAEAIRVGAHDEARSLLQEGLRLDKRDAHTWLSLARLEARVGKADEARDLFERATVTCPDNVRLIHARAVFETRSGEPDAARALFRLAADLEPANAYVSHAWGLLEESLGNASAAQRIYADLMNERPQAQVCVAWAGLEAREGNLQRARAIYLTGWELYDLGPWGMEEDNEACAQAAAAGTAAAAADDVKVDAAAAAAAASEAPLPLMQPPSSSAEPSPPRKQQATDKAVSDAVDLLIEWASLETAAGNVSAAGQLLSRSRQLQPQRARVHTTAALLEVQRGNHAAARQTFERASALPGAGRDEQAVEFSELFNTWAAFEARNGDLQAARKVLDVALHSYPRDASLRQTLGTLQRRAGDAKGALQSFRDSIKMEPRGATYVAYALLEADLGNVDRARTLFEAGAAADPSHGPLHSARAKFEARHGSAEAARGVLREAIEKCPCATVWSAWGKLEERQGNLNTAAQLYEKGTRGGSGSGRDDHAYLWHSLGSVRLLQRQLPGALDAFEEGLKRTPASSQLLLGAAVAHSQLGRSEKARGLFLQSVQADASHAHAWQAWGVMEARMGNVDVARDLYHRGLRRCPTHAALWSASAKLEGEAGKPERARRLFQQGIERCPSHATLRAAWAYFEMHQGKARRAEELLTEAQTLDPNLGELYHVRALLCLKLGKPREARAAVDAGMLAAPTHAPLYRVLGAMQDVAGDVEAARTSFREGLRLNPGYAQLYHAFARLEGKLGNWAALNELNQKARTAFPTADEESAPA